MLPFFWNGYTALLQPDNDHCTTPHSGKCLTPSLSHDFFASKLLAAKLPCLFAARWGSEAEAVSEGMFAPSEEDLTIEDIEQEVAGVNACPQVQLNGKGGILQKPSCREEDEASFVSDVVSVSSP
ncbi:unnamed protein product [Effrenium voratum]|nr:unnamed protein product [Effrenium voratum]